MLQSLILRLHKIFNEMKQWIINKTITITSINILFLPNSAKLGSPRYLSASSRFRVSFLSVTDQLYWQPTKNCMLCLKKFSLQKSKVWSLGTVEATSESHLVPSSLHRTSHIISGELSENNVPWSSPNLGLTLPGLTLPGLTTQMPVC